MPGKPAITETLLAQIVGDAFIKGSKLEGLRFGVAIAYLTHYLNEHYLNRIPQATIPTSIPLLLKSLESMAAADTELEQITTQTQLLNFVLQLIERFKQLKAGDYVLLPGGWCSTNSSHAMAYQFQTMAEGRLALTVINGGAGLSSHHQSTSGSDAKKQDLYDPFKSYLIPAGWENNPELIRCLLVLFEPNCPQLHKQQTLGPDCIYEQALPMLCAFVAAQDVSLPAMANERRLTTGHFAGTCTIRTLEELLKGHFPHGASFNTLIYDFHAFSVDDYMEQLCSSADITELARHDLIEDGIRHCLNLLPTATQLAPEKVRVAMLRLRSHQAMLQSYRLSLESQTDAPPPAPITIKKPETKFHPLLPPRSQMQPTTQVPPHIADVQLPQQLQGGTQLFVELEQCLQQLSQSQNVPKAYLLGKIEQLLFGLPLPERMSQRPSAFYSLLVGPQTALRFFGLVASLQDHYFAAANDVLSGRVVLPRMLLVKMTTFTLIYHLERFFPLIPNKPFGAHIVNMMHQLAVTEANSPYLAQHNLQYDQQLQKIHHLFTHDQACQPERYPDAHIYSPNFREHYNALLEAHCSKEVLGGIDQQYHESYQGDRSDFHRSLQEIQLTRLFMLTRHTAQFAQQKKYAPVIAAIAQQSQLEKYYAKYLARLRGISDPAPHDTVTVEEVSVRGTKICRAVLKTVYGSLHHELGINSALTRSIYDLPHNSASNIFLQEIQTKKAGEQKLSSKQVQLSVAQMPTVQRQLFHLRHHPASQIIQTLAYFNNHHEHTAETGLPSYIEGNISQPGLLLKELQSSNADARFWALLTEFMSRGIRHHLEDHELRPPCIFYLKLVCKVLSSAYQLDPQRHRQKLVGIAEQISLLSNGVSDRPLVASLHLLQFFLLSTPGILGDRLDDTESQRIFAATLQSMFIMQAHKPLDQTVDTNFSLQILERRQTFSLVVKAHSRLLSANTIHEIYQQLELPRTASRAVCTNTPNWSLGDFNFNVEQGQVYNREGLALGAPPTDVLTHPLLKQLQATDIKLCLLSQDHSIIDIHTEKLQLRFQRINRHYRIFQRVLDAQATAPWLRLLSLTDAQRHRLRLEAHEQICLTDAWGLAEDESLLWLNEDDQQFVVSGDDNKVKYRGLRLDSGLHELHQAGSDALISSLVLTELTKPLAAFEDPKYIRVSYIEGTGFTIDLYRYNLQLQLSPGDNQPKLAHQGVVYHFSPQHKPLGEGVAQMTLVSRGSQKTIALFSRQSFLSLGADSKKTKYYLLEQDKGNVLGEAILNKQAAQKLSYSWQFSDSCEYMLLTLNNDEPVPESTKQALWLAYLYLGSHQPEVAFDLLRRCKNDFGGLVGTYDELLLIANIMSGLPQAFIEPGGVNFNGNRREEVNPASVACKLRTLSLLCAHFQTGKGIHTPEIVTGHRANQLVRQFFHEQACTLFDELSEVCAKTLHRYYILEHEQKCHLLLTEHELQQVENYIASNHIGQRSALSYGAIGYRHLKRQLATLKQLSHNITSAGGNLSIEQQRLAANLQHFSLAQEKVISKETRLRRQELTVLFNRDTWLNESMLSQTAKETIHNCLLLSHVKTSTFSDHEKQQAVNALHSATTVETFIQQLDVFFSIAISPPCKTRDMLRDYCHKLLKSKQFSLRHDKLDNMTLLAAVFLRLCNHQPSRGVEVRAQSLRELIEICAQMPADSITVLVLQNDYRTPLITAHDLWRHTPASARNNLTPMLARTPAKSFQLKSLPKPIVAAWRKHELIYNTGKKDPQDEMVQPSGRGLVNSAEFQAGINRFRALVQLKDIAASIGDDTLSAVHDELLAKEKVLDVEAANLSRRLIAVSSEPSDPSLMVNWRIAAAASKRQPVSIDKLLDLYARHELEPYEQELGITLDLAKTIQVNLCHYVATLTALQQVRRCQGKLRQLKHTATEDAPAAVLTQRKFELACELLTENICDPTTHPELSLLQLRFNILLRHDQLDAITSLTHKPADTGQFNCLIKKIPMGRGKTSYIIPGATVLKADGTNLVAVVVPSAQLMPTFLYLKDASNRLYGRPVVQFQFNRETRSDAQNLQAIYQDLCGIIVNRGYIVTDANSLQSVKLKFFEVVAAKPNRLLNPTTYTARLANWDRQAKLFESIYELFRAHLDMIVDEGHEVLAVNKKTYFAEGEPEKISPQAWQQTLALYDFFHKVDLSHLLAPGITLDHVMCNNKLVGNESTFNRCMAELAKQLLHHPDSPLFAIISKYQVTANNLSLLLDYLQHEDTALPECLEHATKAEHETLKLYQHQVSKLLPWSLGCKEGVEYGPASAVHLSVAEKAIAVPYITTEHPDPNSRYAKLTTINLTIQSLRIRGISFELMKLILQQQKQQARHELTLLVEADKERTYTVVDTEQQTWFAEVSGGLSLDQISMNDPVSLQQLHLKLKHFRPFLSFALSRFILGEITIDARVMQSNNLNFVDLPRSIQALTGTPRFGTYNDRLKHQVDEALGADAFIAIALAEKQPAIHDIDYHQPTEYIASILSRAQNQDQLRATIDLNAVFNTLSNEEVARIHAEYIADNPAQFSLPTPVRYVIYFDHNDLISAIPVDNNAHKVAAIPIGPCTTSAITSRLGHCPQSELYVFFDRAHCIATNLELAEQAQALVLLTDYKTSFSQFLQAISRMRGLAHACQSAQIVVPTTLRGKSYLDLLELMYQNQLKQTADETEEATALKPAARQCADAITRFMSAAAPYSPSLIPVPPPMAMTKVQLFADVARHIYQTTDSQSIGTRVQVQHTSKSQLQVQIHREPVNNSTRESEYVPWFNQDDAFDPQELHFMSIAGIFNYSGADGVPPFTPNLLASGNFYCIHDAQHNFVSDLAMPVNALLFIHNQEEQLECILLSPQELAELARKNKTTMGGKAWVMLASQELLYGEPPAGMLQSRAFQILIEQACYFAGEIDLLQRPKVKLQWLLQDTEEKLQFLKEVIRPLRGASLESIQRLEKKITVMKAEPPVSVAVAAVAQTATASRLSRQTVDHATDDVAQVVKKKSIHPVMKMPSVAASDSQQADTAPRP